MEAVYAPVATVQAMMDVEAGWARARARSGLMPMAAATAITSLCRAELYDVPALLGAAPRAGSLVLPLVQRLRETVALFDPAAAAFVHQGLEEQDVMDNAMLLQTREGLRLLDEDLQSLCQQLLEQALDQPGVPLLQRRAGQPLRVGSLRERLLNWLLPLLRSAEHLRQQSRQALCLQWGPDMGPTAAALAQELRLPLAEMGWQTQRDRWIRLATELALLGSQLRKLALDLVLLAQPERAEVRLGEGGAAALELAQAAAQRLPARVASLVAGLSQPLEGGPAQWQAELAEWQGLMLGSHAALQALLGVWAERPCQAQRLAQLATDWLGGDEAQVRAQALQADARMAALLPRAQQLLEQLAARPLESDR